MDFMTLEPGTYYAGNGLIIKVKACGSITVRARNLDGLIICPEAGNQITVRIKES